MITIYAPDAVDFSTLGEGALCPSECVIEEQALGQYSLTMTHPMDAGGKWRMIAPGCILKAPAPVRETPLAVEDGEGAIPSEPETVTRHIYRVQTNTGANLHLRQGPSTSTRILSKYRPGTEVVVLSQSGGWGRVIVRSSGAAGYMSMEYLVWVRDEAETIAGDAPSPQRVVYPAQSRMQLFRIASVERDAAAREVRVTAQHIFYDLLGNIVGSEYAPENVAASAVVEQLFARALNAHAFDVHCSAQTSVSGDYTRRGLVECLLDPDDGVAPQAEARLIRDNFDIWLLPDLPRETGVTIRHAKDLLGAAMTTDAGSVVTRIIPVGEDADGKPLLLTGTVYVDSPRISDYPLIYARAIDYDVKIGQDGVANAAQARAKLKELAEADFANGLDLPSVSLDVDFAVLGETEEYRRYADLQAVHLYDTVRVVAKEAGIDAAVRVTGYKWDALGRRYESVTLGELTEVKTSVYGYQLADKSVGTVKLQNGAVGSAQLRDLAVQYAHINTAAVEQLSANSLTALKAYIHELAAESVTTDQLYADLASIALAQITTANIASANIDWASIGALSANIATIAKAHLADADIEWADIANLTAAVADIAEAKIAGASITAAQIDDLNAVVAEIMHAQVAAGEFDFAEVENFLGSVFVLGQGVAGSVSIENLTVTQANMLGAVIGSLVLPGEDGKYYEITVGTDGALSTAEVAVSAGEAEAGVTEGGKPIAATSINAESIHGSTVTAQQGILNAILTQALTAGQITAGQALIASATVPTLYATSIQAIGNSLTFTANERIQLIVSSVSQAQSAAEAAQTAANNAQSAAEAAQGTADDAASAAQTAQSTANTAQQTATGAQTAANAAQQTANGAQSAASAAQSTANAAQSAADANAEAITGLTGRVTIAETAIEQTQQAITFRATKEEVEDSIEAVTGSVDAVSQAVEELGELVVSPDELVSRVTTSSAFQTLQSEVSQTASGLTFTQSAVSDIEGRVENLESGVHIGADGIGIYRSDYPYQMQLGAGGWAIRNGDAETIAARESKMFAPRVQVNDALIMDHTAWKIGSDGCLRWIRYLRIVRSHGRDADQGRAAVRLGDLRRLFRVFGPQHHPALGMFVPALRRYLLAGLVARLAAVRPAVFVDARGANDDCHIVVRAVRARPRLAAEADGAGILIDFYGPVHFRAGSTGQTVYSAEEVDTGSGHTAVVLTNGDRYDGEVEEPSIPLGSRILRDGSEGKDVEDLQRRLKAAGYDPGDVDGEYGPNTEAAVKALQKDAGILVDGEFGPDSLKALMALEVDDDEETESTPATGNVLISGGDAYIRTGPGKQYDAAGVAENGDKLVYANEDNWVPVLVNGRILWVSGKYAKVVSA